MLAKGRAWSSFVRTTSHGCGPSGLRGVWTFMGRDPGGLTARHDDRAAGFALEAAFSDGDTAARGLDSLGGELLVEHTVDRRLAVGLDEAVGDVVVDRPLRPLRVEALVDRPDAVLRLDVPGVFDRFLRLAGRLDHYRDDLVLLAINGAVGL